MQTHHHHTVGFDAAGDEPRSDNTGLEADAGVVAGEANAPEPRPGGSSESEQRALPPDPSILGRARGTDFYRLEELLTEQERAVRDRVRAFCDEQVLDRAASYWDEARFPVELLDGYAELGVAGGSLAGDGCPGMSPLAEGLVVAELARGDGSMATLHGVHSGLAMRAIGLLADADQRARWLPAMARGQRLGAFALTEPEHGSDVVQLGTTARREGSQWVLQGHKRWIGNGGVADVVVVWARDEAGDVGAFVVDHGDRQPRRGEYLDGYRARTITHKTANRGVWQAQIDLDEVRVPAENRLTGAKSFHDTNTVLAGSRQAVAWEALGHAVACYEVALGYAEGREQFSRPLASFQLVQDKLSHMLADVTTMQLVCLRLAQLQAAGEAELPQAALAKLHCADAARRVGAAARDVLGGNGILLDYHVARHHADIEAVYTYEGTDSVQSLIVGRAVTGHSAFA